MGNESIIGIILTFLLLVYLMIQVIMTLKNHYPPNIIHFILIVIGVIFALLLIYRGKELVARDLAEIILTIGLVTITAVYAWSTQRQAEASVKMAEEMREQRYDAVRPVIDIYRDPTDEDKMSEAIAGTEGNTSQGLSCVMQNIGLGPAIDLCSFVQNPFSGERQRHEFGTLAIGKTTYRMKLALAHEASPTALVTYYRDVYGRAFVSRREVSTDKKKGWIIGPLQIRPIKEDELP